MKKILVAAAAALALAGAATTASATTFTGSYDVTNYNTGSGLIINIADAGSPGTGFSFNLSSIGSSATRALFNISTPEGSVQWDDLFSKPITVGFTFTAPGAVTGSVDGTTRAETIGIWSDGVVHWQDTTLNFGSAGNLLVHLNDAHFGGDWGTDLSSRSAEIDGTFTLRAPSAVPEPMSWALMLAGFFGMGAAMRANRLQRATFAA